LSLFALGLISRQFIHYEFEGDRSLPRFGTVGELLQYPVLLKNLTAQPQAGLKMMETIPHEFPTFKEFLRIRDRFAMGRDFWGEWRQYLAKRRPAIAPLKNLPVLTARLKTEVVGEILPLRRGRLGLAELTLACPDPLGLSYRRVSDFHAQSVCILPKRYQLPPFLPLIQGLIRWGMQSCRHRWGRRWSFALCGIIVPVTPRIRFIGKAGRRWDDPLSKNSRTNRQFTML
jgi:hypothetical protein